MRGQVFPGGPVVKNPPCSAGDVGLIRVSYVGGELLVEEAAGFPDETITGLQSVEETEGQRTAYSLQGHRLPSVPQKGLYVVKGKKQISR